MEFAAQHGAQPHTDLDAFADAVVAATIATVAGGPACVSVPRTVASTRTEAPPFTLAGTFVHAKKPFVTGSSASPDHAGDFDDLFLPQAHVGAGNAFHRDCRQSCERGGC